MIYLCSLYSLSASAAVSFAAPIFINSFKVLQLLRQVLPRLLLVVFKRSRGWVVFLYCPRSSRGFSCIVARSGAASAAVLISAAVLVCSSGRSPLAGSSGGFLFWRLPPVVLNAFHGLPLVGCVFTLPAVVGGLPVRCGVSCVASEVVRGAAVSSSAAGASGCGRGRIGAGCCPRLGCGCAGLVVLPSLCGSAGRYCRPCWAAGVFHIFVRIASDSFKRCPL